jgi:hypothetical protein
MSQRLHKLFDCVGGFSAANISIVLDVSQPLH